MLQKSDVSKSDSSSSSSDFVLLGRSENVLGVLDNATG